MAALNIQDAKNGQHAAPLPAGGNAVEISAQKKYKLELQAEINKLRSKY